MSSGEQANMDNDGRWHHVASEAEVRRTMASKGLDVIEWGALGKTFVVSYRHLTIVRTTTLGGDTYDIEVGWVYANDIALRLDLVEIQQVARNVTR